MGRGLWMKDFEPFFGGKEKNSNLEVDTVPEMC